MSPDYLLCLDVIQEIAEFIAERDGHPAQADRIYLTNGASEGKVSLALPPITVVGSLFLSKVHPMTKSTFSSTV